METKKIYDPLIIEVIAVQMEKGYAISGSNLEEGGWG